MRVTNLILWAAAAALGMAAPAQAQISTIDPNTAIDGDLDGGPPPSYDQQTPPADYDYPPADNPVGDPTPPAPAAAQNQTAVDARAQATDTFHRDDLLGAAEDVFGKGASGLAGILEDILREQGEPNAYIAGREAGGAVVLGLRYGSGTMVHRVEGQRPVYWTGPSVGFDFGGDAANVFVLVYNLYDSQELYRRFPQGEGRIYFVGGFSASYLRRDDIVLIPVRLGVGWRLGVNAGYMKFSEKQRWLPF